MNTQISENKIFDTLAAEIAEALCIEAAKINLESRLYFDLGAESIDILDIGFRIEEKFGVKIDPEGLIQNLGDGLSATQMQEKFTVAILVAYIYKRLQPQERQ